MDQIKTTYFFAICLLILLQIPPVAGNTQKLFFASKPQTRVAAGVQYQYKFSAIDSAANPITYNCETLPSWLHFDKKTNTLSGKYTKPGQYPIRINASTADTATRQWFMLTVSDTKTVNILPLGNSITNGTSTYNSYRRSLWQLLHADNYNFDFIGSWSLHHMGGAVPDPDFDTDHDGHSGWTAHDVLQPPGWDEQRGNIDKWLKVYRPDIVLVELGTNDVFQCVNTDSSMKALSIIIDKCRQRSPAVKILLSQIPPLGDQWAPKNLCGNDTSYGEVVKRFNNAIIGLGKRKTSVGSPVIIVDQFTGFDPTINMYDDIHPNEKGEMEMAKRWYMAVKPFLQKLK